MNLKDKLLGAKSQLEEWKVTVTELESSILAELGVVEGDLILHNKQHYRVKRLMLDADLNPYICTKEIRNNSVNWESCSTPKLYASEFEKVEWEWDKERLEYLADEYHSSDSVSERESLYSEIENMFLFCHHKWKYDYREEEYICECCGAITKKEITKDWLNGETEHHNIDLERTLAEWI